MRHARVQGAGIFKDAASDETIRALFFSGTIRDWQIVVPDFGTIAGPFQISGLDFSGQHDRELTFDVSLESAGELIFTAA